MNFKTPSRNLSVAGEDYFESLSDELIASHIVGKISTDARSLCMLSMVSKRMESLVFQAETVSIKIPCWGGLHKPKSSVSVKIPPRPIGPGIRLPGGSLWGKLLDCLPIPFLQPFKYFPPGVTFRVALRSAELFLRLEFGGLKFLRKFRFMRSLNVEYDFCCSRICSLSNNENPMVKFKLGSNFGTVLMVGGVEFLDDYDIGVQGHENINTDCRAEVKALIWHFLMDILFPVVAMEGSLRGLLQPEFKRGRLQRLQNVVLGDRRHGKVVIGHLIDMRNMKGERQKHFEVLTEKDFNVRFAPVLKLPSSGCVMTTVVLVGYKDREIDGDVDELMLREGFAAEDQGKEGEEEAYVKEAALAMLEKEVIYKGIKLTDCLENLEGRV